MKKIFVISAAVIAAVVMSSCGSNKESAYRKAYEKAKSQEQVVEQQPVQQAPVVNPVVQQPVQQQAPATTNYDNVSVRQENLTLVSGAGLKAYSVVVGSFGVKANAEGLTRTLNNAGYNAQIAYNSARNMYRVIATTFDNKIDAARSRDQLTGAYPGAWLLYNK